MPRTFAALDLTWPEPPDESEVDLALSHLDDCGATAVEPTPDGARLFFTSAQERDLALSAASALIGVRAMALMVPDDDWAERSQASLTPVRVGRIIVTPPWITPAAGPDDIVIVIQPSMGFGTGHHPTTRLCLSLLQELRVRDRAVLDVGTGSGVLAIAAARLGAASALGIDYDADALVSAEENLDLNRARDTVSTRAVDIVRQPATGAYGVITANLTGAMLVTCAGRLVAELGPGGALIASGFQRVERDDVVAAFAGAGMSLTYERAEDEWMAARFERHSTDGTE
jgi:ribosomal protein L11 methyltransferase